MKVLVVEDNQNLANAMGIRLKSHGYACKNAHDAITAMSEAVKFEPDIVVIDINLPGGDGFLVADRLRASATSGTPFIFMTASKKEGLRQRAQMAGAAGYLEKPFTSSSLIELIEESVH